MKFRKSKERKPTITQVNAMEDDELENVAGGGADFNAFTFGHTYYSQATFINCPGCKCHLTVRGNITGRPCPKCGYKF